MHSSHIDLCQLIVHSVEYVNVVEELLRYGNSSKNENLVVDRSDAMTVHRREVAAPHVDFGPCGV